MDGQTEDHTPEDEMMEEIGGVVANLIAEAITPLLRQFDDLHHRVAELERRAGGAASVAVGEPGGVSGLCLNAWEVPHGRTEQT